MPTKNVTMPTKNVSITLTDADGLASFTDAAMLVLYLSREEVESANVASALERLHIIADTRESAMGSPRFQCNK